MSNVCKICGRLLLMSNCLNLDCSASKQKKSSPVKKLKSRSKPKTKKKKLQKLPDLTKPIPPKVNSSKYTEETCTSLLTFLKYSRAANQTDDIRKENLLRIIGAGPFIPSRQNKQYIESFFEVNSKKRVQAIIDLLEWQVSGMFWVKKNPIRHASKIPAINKAEADIEWLKSIISDYR
jgi:hypothetical protein